jgi:hypothetical protein
MRWRVGALAGIMALLLFWSAIADEVTTTSSFAVDIGEVVHIELVPASIGSITTHRRDLLQQYLEIGTIDIRVYTISNYNVWFSKTTVVTEQAPGGTTTAFETIRDELMELRLEEFGGADDYDRGVDDNPSLTYSEAVTWADIPDTTVRLLFTGGNTEGGALNYQYARAAFRFDLAALRNNASGNIYDFTIRLTITDPTT